MSKRKANPARRRSTSTRDALQAIRVQNIIAAWAAEAALPFAALVHRAEHKGFSVQEMDTGDFRLLRGPDCLLRGTREGVERRLRELVK